MKHRIHLPPKGTGLDSDAEAPGRWDLRLKEEAFAFFAKGDIIRHDPGGATHRALLHHAGHSVVDEDVMDECIKANEHGKLNVLSREYIFDFFRSYEAELRKATEVAFLGKAHFGTIQVRQLYDLIKQVGFVLSAGDLQELLEEAAVALGVPSFMAAVSYAADNWRLVYAYPAVSSNLNASLENRNVDFTLFSFLMEGLAERDGFTRSQHGRLCAAFQRLDADESGFLEEDELPALRVWLSFCSPHEGANAAVEEAQQLTRERAEQEIMLIPKDETRLGTLQPQLQGHLSLPDFLQMMRRHFNAEYFRTQHAFRKMDGDKDAGSSGESGEPSHNDSYLDLLEMRGLFQTLGLELTPRSLFEAVSFHHLGETFSHSDFLLILEYLRDTEGLCEDSWSEARGLSLKQSFDRHFVSGGFAKGDTSSGHADPFVDGTIEYSFEGSFYHFDVHSDGFISTRRAQSALEWNGFHLGMSVYSSKTDWKDRLTRSKVGEAEFLRICREQEEAETRIARTVFRKYAEKGGAGPLRREKLQLALKMVNVRYTSFFTDWLKKTTELPGQLDFEDFRDIVASFRQMNRDAYRAHSRFTQKEVNSLDDCFRKLGPDRNGKLLHGKVAELFESLYPALKWDPKLRETMRNSLKLHSATSKPLSLDGFLEVLRTFEDTCASALDEAVELVARDLSLSPSGVDDFLEAYHICRSKGAGGVRSIANTTLCKVLYQHKAQEPLTLQEESALYQAERIWIALAKVLSSYQVFKEMLGPPGPLRLEEFMAATRKLRSVPVQVLTRKGKGSKAPH
ncbi:unnamed protein product [Symbiodinium microadriaticum]|nr:unnamed protein product [Symbiodinium microadriaticum]